MHWCLLTAGVASGVIAAIVVLLVLVVVLAIVTAVIIAVIVCKKQKQKYERLGEYDRGKKERRVKECCAQNDNAVDIPIMEIHIIYM